MLDRVGTGADCAHHALGGGGVDGDEPPGIMGGGDPGIELSLREGDPRRLALAPMIIGVEFDDVRAGRDLVAYRANGLVDARDLLRTLRDGDARLVALGSIGAARDDRL